MRVICFVYFWRRFVTVVSEMQNEIQNAYGCCGKQMCTFALPNAHRTHTNTDAQKYRENTPRGIEMRAHSINEGN